MRVRRMEGHGFRGCGKTRAFEGDGLLAPARKHLATTTEDTVDSPRSCRVPCVRTSVRGPKKTGEALPTNCLHHKRVLSFDLKPTGRAACRKTHALYQGTTSAR